jgi:hypothetical protein
VLGPAANTLSAHFINKKIEGRWRDRHHGSLLYLAAASGSHHGTFALPCPTFGSMTFGATIALWKEKRKQR